MHSQAQEETDQSDSVRRNKCVHGLSTNLLRPQKTKPFTTTEAKNGKSVLSVAPDVRPCCYLNQ